VPVSNPAACASFFTIFLSGAFMHVAALRIKNFRGIQSAHVRFAPHTVFIGPNNCGKTTIIESLALLFGRDRLIRELTEHDFFGSDPTATDRISIVATICVRGRRARGFGTGWKEENWPLQDSLGAVG
jgi:hypothetical protein